MKIIDYRIIKAATPEQMEVQVEASMKFGWQPQGGVSGFGLTLYGERCRFYQAMVRFGSEVGQFGPG